MKKNCSDPFDRGQFCWTDNQKAHFIGAFFYGYALQMIPAFLAAKMGYNTSLRFATLLSGVIQLTVPMTIQYSWTLTVVLQAVKGFAAGVFLAGSLDVARKWSLDEEGKLAISLSGTTLSAGNGFGPFLVGILTEHLGWSFPYYLSGAIFVFLFLMQCVIIPDDPAEAMLMSAKERAMFKKKQQAESTSSSEEENRYKVSLSSILRRPSLYCMSIFSFVHMSVHNPEFTVIPFYFNEFFGANTEFLSYLQAGLSMTTAIAVVGWKCVLTLLDKKISWLKSRMTMLMVPLAIRSINVAVLPYTGNMVASILLLLVNDLMMGATFSGGLVTVAYELDPFNGPVVFGIVNGVGEFSGFLVPLMRAALTNVDTSETGYWDKYEQRWQWFFLLCGGMGIAGVIAIVIGLLCWRDEWRMHDTLTTNAEKDERETKGDEKGYMALDQDKVAC